ncbi:MAG: hypothetical protein PVJ28_00145 [Acidimicrobiia bacterium]|jgi:hypothetical protein
MSTITDPPITFRELLRHQIAVGEQAREILADIDSRVLGDEHERHTEHEWRVLLGSVCDCTCDGSTLKVRVA